MSMTRYNISTPAAGPSVWIRNVKVRYSDDKLTSAIDTMQKIRPMARKEPEDLSKYRFSELTQAGLANTNYAYEYNRHKREFTSSEVLHNEVDPERLLFTARDNFIEVSADTCLALFLLSRDHKTAAGVHLYSKHIHPYFPDKQVDLDTYRDVVMHAYANIRRLIPDESAVTAYISGCYPAPYFSENRLHNRTLFQFLLPLLISRGVRIEVLDIGAKYTCQHLNLNTGEFTVETEG